MADFQHVFIDEKQHENSSALSNAPVFVKRGWRITQFSDGMQTPPHVKPLCRYHYGNVTNAPHLIQITQSFGSAPYRVTQKGLKPIVGWMESVKALVLDRKQGEEDANSQALRQWESVTNE